MDTQLIVRLIVSIITIVNLLANQFGFCPIDVDNENIYTAVSTIAALVAWVWGFWKNNNFTQAAKEGQKVIDRMKVVDSTKSK